MRQIAENYRRYLLETLESRTLLNAAPVGVVDVLDRNVISGWAYDPDEGATALTIEITIDSETATATADQLRNDLAAVIGTRYHGFSFAMPTLGPGNHNVTVEAVDPITNERTTLRTATVANPAPLYSVDLVSATKIQGWLFDSDTPSTARQIRVDINGVQGTPVTANASRPDLVPFFGGANFGFDLTGSYSGKTIDIYSIDAPSGEASLIYTNNKAVFGVVDVNNGSIVSGWAYDPDNPTAVVKVRVDIDGVAGTPFDANATRNDLTPIIGSANHGFSLSLTTLSPGQHTVAVYVLDATSSSATPKLIGQAVVQNRPPVGNVDIVNATQIKGWAYEPDLGASAATVNVYVDDFFFTTVQANQARPDLLAGLGSQFHGFTVDLTSLAAGSHSITVTVEDDRNSSQDEIVLFDDFINNQTPIGVIDVVTGTSILGWAHDFDAGSNPTDVDLYVNGEYINKYSANVTRNDLTAVLGSANHGFNIALPPLKIGENLIEIYASESQGNVSSLIGSKTVVNNRPIGALDTATATTVTGWAADPNTLGTAVNVKVYINNVPQTLTVANAARSDLTPVLGSPNYGITYTLPTLTSGTYEISLYAQDSNNTQLVWIGSKVVVVP